MKDKEWLIGGLALIVIVAVLLLITGIGFSVLSQNKAGWDEPCLSQTEALETAFEVESTTTHTCFVWDINSDRGTGNCARPDHYTADEIDDHFGVYCKTEFFNLMDDNVRDNKCDTDSDCIKLEGKCDESLNYYNHQLLACFGDLECIDGRCKGYYLCGNGICDELESYDSCPDDCNEPVSETECGDGVCEDGETQTECPEDCGYNEPEEPEEPIEPEEPKMVIPSWMIIVSIVIILAIIVMGIFILLRK